MAQSRRADKEEREIVGWGILSDSHLIRYPVTSGELESWGIRVQSLSLSLSLSLSESVSTLLSLGLTCHCRREKVPLLL